MGNWHLIACLGMVSVGVLTFLRLVSNEIHAVENEAEHLRWMEQAKKRPAAQETVEFERAG